MGEREIIKEGTKRQKSLVYFSHLAIFIFLTKGKVKGGRGILA